MIISKTLKLIMRTDPIIFVIGCTGTGKSDLGVAIAKKYGGEIISVDSMQFYRGLDIATNKITEEEAEGVAHHMMSFLDPSKQSTYSVHHFREATLQLIREIKSRQNIPVIVGGTTYYAESILYENNLIAGGHESEHLESAERKSEELEVEFEGMSNQELWAELRRVDDKSALLLHPNNRFRVQRAIQIFRQTGITKSEHVKQQKSDDSVDLGGRLRFDDSLVIFMDASAEVLDERLDGRVEKMMRMGLKNELTGFYDQHCKFIDASRFGVMQCIGLKEFVPWLQMDSEDRETEKGAKAFQKGCEDVKLHTRQYSRKQRRWFKSRLLRRSDGERKMASAKALDTSDKTRIIGDGMEIVDEWMGGADLFDEIPVDSRPLFKGDDANVNLRCEICEITMTGRENWDKHLKGKKHKHNAKQSMEKRFEGVE